MNKKWLAALVTVVMAGTCAAGLAACNKGNNNGGGDDGPTHDYDTSYTAITESDGTSEYHTHKCKDESCNVVSGTEKHTYSEGTVNAASTCVTAGSKTYTCTECGYSYNEDLPLAEHSWGEWSVAEGDEPDEDTAGAAKRTCTVTGCTAEDTLTIPSLAEGEFKTEVITAATCTTDGTTKHTYTKGGESVSFNITVLKGHKYVAEYVWNARTVTVNITCSGCDNVSESLQNATYEDDNLSATCEHTGYEKRTATVTYDGQTFSDTHTVAEYPQTDHSFSTRNHSETEHWLECNYCHTKNTESVAPHDFENGTRSNKIVKRPTATEKGVREIMCSCTYKKNFEFDGVESTCEITSFETRKTNAVGEVVSTTQLSQVDGTYYHLGDGEAIYAAFDKQINGFELLYSLTGTVYVAAPSVLNHTNEPVAYLLDAENNSCIIRFYKVGENYPAQLYIKAVIYVTEESIAVEKSIKFAPVPTLEKPQAEIYSETTFAYEWANIADTTVYVGQDYKIKALDYNVTVGEQSITLNEQGEGTFTATTAGKYTVTVVSPYNSNDSYTAQLTVKEAVDTSALFAGTYAGGEYTVTFGEDNAITVSKEGEDDISLIYTYAEEVFTTAGSETVSIILTPTYKLFIVVGEEKTELVSGSKYSDEIYAILGGTSWTKDVLPYDSSLDAAQVLVDITINFNADGTGNVVKYFRRRKTDGALQGEKTTSYNFTYVAVKSGNEYTLEFAIEEYTGTGGENIFEVGTCNTVTGNDFSIINKEGKSFVTVDGDNVSLTLWLRTGHYNQSSSTEQAVNFDKVVAE